MSLLLFSHKRVPAKTGHRGSDQLQQVQGWEWRGSGGCGDGALSPERGRAQRRQQGQHGQVQVGGVIVTLMFFCSATYFLLRFHPFPPSHHLNQRQWHDPGFWYWHYLKHPEMQVSKLLVFVMTSWHRWLHDLLIWSSFRFDDQFFDLMIHSLILLSILWFHEFIIFYGQFSDFDGHKIFASFKMHDNIFQKLHIDC